MRKNRTPHLPDKRPARQNTRKTGGGLRPLASMTETLIRPAMKGRAALLTRLIARWPELGGEMATWSQPVDVRHPRGSAAESTLILSIPSGRGPQAQMLAPAVCDRINALMGFKMIARIQFRQDLPLTSSPHAQTAQADISAPERRPAPKRKRLAEQTQMIDSPPLRDALIRLGEAIEDEGADPGLGDNHKGRT